MSRIAASTATSGETRSRRFGAAAAIEVSCRTDNSPPHVLCRCGPIGRGHHPRKQALQQTPKCHENAKWRPSASQLRVLASRPNRRSRATQQGGSNDQTDCSIVFILDGGGGFRLRAAVHAQ